MVIASRRAPGMCCRRPAHSRASGTRRVSGRTAQKARGYAVRLAADGTEALHLIEEHPFDLLLLDVNLPGPNGLQVLEAVRRSAEVPVLMVSCRARERDKVEALDLGADDFLSKPFGIAELLGARQRVAATGHSRTARTDASVPISGAGG
jgi:two-component system, OmpR family, KDP operon response regulator KdpE